ncbi:MAG: peptidyl-prolyl cis-trans isomerase B (cyclophilin B) [Candidatus Azotimanducaceae bacterium]|jgi:peptidyl-prolyl cis-trans isomerase B (cyclophilin B)
METTKGTIHINFFPEKAPMTVANFANLSSKGYYNGLKFHRVISSFMVQGGCPQGTGTGGPGYNFADEFDSSLKHEAPGKLSMANAGPGTNGSQFFITHVPTPHLDGAHTVFGEVVSAADQEVVDAIEQGDEITKITISGDLDDLLAAQEANISKWNGIIADKFPDLS